MVERSGRVQLFIPAAEFFNLKEIPWEIASAAVLTEGDQFSPGSPRKQVPGSTPNFHPEPSTRRPSVIANSSQILPGSNALSSGVRLHTSAFISTHRSLSEINKETDTKNILLTFGFLSLERTFYERSSNVRPRGVRELPKVSAGELELGCGSLRPRPVTAPFGQCQLSRLQAPPGSFDSISTLA